MWNMPRMGNGSLTSTRTSPVITHLTTKLIHIIGQVWWEVLSTDPLVYSLHPLLDIIASYVWSHILETCTTKYKNTRLLQFDFCLLCWNFDFCNNTKAITVMAGKPYVYKKEFVVLMVVHWFSGQMWQPFNSWIATERRRGRQLHMTEHK